jgi:hypothetical protein
LPPRCSRSIYLIADYKTVMIVSGGLLGLGFVNVLFATLLLTCGYKRRFLLKLYLLCMGIVEIAQAVLASLFLVSSERASIIDAILPDSDENNSSLRNWLDGNVETAGAVLLTLVGVQLVALVFAGMQTCATDKSFDEDYQESQTSALLSAGDDNFGYGRTAAARRDKLISSGDRFNALADEGLSAAATDRARTKYSDYYTKYSRT